LIGFDIQISSVDWSCRPAEKKERAGGLDHP
jgi:hypothetical protein